MAGHIAPPTVGMTQSLDRAADRFDGMPPGTSEKGQTGDETEGFYPAGSKPDTAVSVLPSMFIKMRF